MPQIRLDKDVNDGNIHTHATTLLLQRCVQAPYIDLCVHTSAGKVCPIREHGKSPDLVVVQEWVSDRLVGLKVPDAN
jgi:hypothetical protein